MKKTLSIPAIAILLLIVSPAFSQQDIKGSKDHPLLTRMPDFFISGYKEAEYEAYRFISTDKKNENIEGHKYYIEYKITPGNLNPES